MNPVNFDALPPLSPRAAELLAVSIEDDDAEQQLLTIVSNEPQLAARLVAVANSAAHGGASSRIASVPQAIRRIGMRQAMQMATGMLFGHPVSARLSDQAREQLWLHSVSMATACREVARLLKYHDGSDAYLHGLLHDLGYMLAELTWPGALERVCVFALEQSLTIEQAEREQFGREHGELTAMLLEHWHAPATFAQVHRNHHLFAGRSNSLAGILCAAESIVSLDEFGRGVFGTTINPFACLARPREVVESLLLKQLKLQQSELDRLLERMLDNVAEIGGLGRSMAAI
ncbi:MAG: HDOD domain-containing protein [Zoogloeaceae bacterium]|nr:HDOD domain-containing protein [Rhodocyclaceae bacterium]MCP5237715.1 HDOD domain-containing protein [Zoogloeaceae bacterium]